MNILGLKITSHDTGAAIMSDNGVIAIAEERLNRIKHSRGMFPELSIAYCLNALGVKSEEIDYVVIDQVGHQSVFNMAEKFRTWDSAGRFAKAKVKVINHHDAHAATAFFCSPFQAAAVLIYDGSGEQFVNHYGVKADETETLYYGHGTTIQELHKTTHARIGRRKFPYTFGIGKLYSLISGVYLNFGKYNEGKLMGLAAYGQDHILKEFPPERWFKTVGNDIVCNAQIDFPKLRLDAMAARKLFSLKVIGTIYNIFKTKLVRWRKRVFQLLLQSVFTRADEILFADPKIFEPIRLSRGPRLPEVALPDQYYSSVAYAVQKVLEMVAVAWGKKLRALTHTDNICIAGGVGLNIDANKHFINKVGFKNIFVQPAATDTGIPLGCALYGWHVLAQRPRTWEMKSASLGKTYSEPEVKAALEKYSSQITVKKSDNICKETARFLADAKIVGWVQGGSEYGPRALGNRSILCNPTGKDTKDILNNRVKHRESWRPFATSILAEHVREWFELDIPSPFMLFEGPVLLEKKDIIPAVIHVDGTSRIQVVTPESNRRYYELIKEFFALSGIPLVLNTSFNLGGDPIVETPEDAITTFLKTNMDRLIIEDYIVSKKY